MKLSESELTRYAGWYRDPSHGGVLRLFVRDGRLVTSDVEGDDTPFELTPAGAGRFFILLGGVPVNRFEFRSEPDGSIAGAAHVASGPRVDTTDIPSSASGRLAGRRVGTRGQLPQ